VNLLGNAFKFTGRNGTVTVAMEQQKEDELIKICVSDTGIGNSNNNPQKILLEFWKISKQAKHSSGRKRERGFYFI